VSDQKGWLTGSTPDQRRTLAAASLGWMLDSMDVMVYALILPAIMREMHLTAAISGAIMSATLIAAAIGGLLFGWIADRIGRTRALTASVLVYSIATALCGVAHNAIQLAAFRTLLGFGMGGEWATGAALVAETWPAQHRAKALAFVQSFWAIGYALAALIVALVLPHFGWRAVFFVGILPAVFTLWLRTRVPEPEIWVRQRHTHVSPSALFRTPLARGTWIAATMNAATLFAYWGLSTWVPQFLALPVAHGGRGLSIVQTSGWTIAMQAGAFCGYLCFGYAADRLGRKRTYIGYLLIAALAIPLFAFVTQPQWLLLIGPMVGFFGTGYFSGFSVIASELFPTSIRATAMGFVYNIGRLLSAAAPYVIGYLSESAGLSKALCTTSLAFLVAAAIASNLHAPEPRLSFAMTPPADAS
jgi:MFS family permease